MTIRTGSKSPREFSVVNNEDFMDPQRFRDLGYLQEVNRQFFHPLGLALALSPDMGKFGVVDATDDPEGIFFADGVIDPDKVEYVRAERNARSADRAQFAEGASIAHTSGVQDS